MSNPSQDRKSEIIITLFSMITGAKSVFKDLLQISAKWNEIGSRLGLAVAGSGRICADSGEEEDDEAFIEKVKHLDKDISVEEIALEDITEVKGEFCIMNCIQTSIYGYKIISDFITFGYSRIKSS